jgi:hypothetical protein
MKSLLLLFIISITAIRLAAESGPVITSNSDYISIQKNAGTKLAVFIKKDHIISISAIDVDVSVHREKPALLITTTGLNVQKNSDQNASGETKTTMASESLSYYFVFDSYEKALAAATSITK